MNTLSVLWPVYNAQGKLAAEVAEILEVLSGWHSPFELCILDDGSTDGTAEEAHELAALYPQVRLIRHPVRLGLAEAIQTGLDHTHGELVLVGDEDYCLDPDDLRTLWRLRDTQRQLRDQAPRKNLRRPRLESLLAWKPGSRGTRRGLQVVRREEFEQFRLQQATGGQHRLDRPRLDPSPALARRLGHPKFLKLATPFASEQTTDLV